RVQLQRPDSGSFYVGTGDIQAHGLVDMVAGANPDVIFHLAAQVDVCTFVSDPQFDGTAMCLAPSISAKRPGRPAFDESYTPRQELRAMERACACRWTRPTRWIRCRRML